MTPETKMITYVILTPEMLIEEIEIDQQLLEEVYAQRISEFRQEEKRRAERLVFLTTKEAETALQSIKDESTSFSQLVNDRGLTGSEIDIGFKTETELGDAGNRLFNANLSEIIGPFETDLGPSLFKLIEIREAKTLTFESAKISSVKN